MVKKVGLGVLSVALLVALVMSGYECGFTQGHSACCESCGDECQSYDDGYVDGYAEATEDFEKRVVKAGDGLYVMDPRTGKVEFYLFGELIETPWGYQLPSDEWTGHGS